jgi:hypothetical protein
MKTQIDCWNEVAEALDVRVEAPASITIGDRLIEFAALLPDFGAPKGMIADPEWAAIEPFADALVAAGYGYSCIVVERAGDMREVLRDWGWSASSPKPRWF